MSLQAIANFLAGDGSSMAEQSDRSRSNPIGAKLLFATFVNYGKSTKILYQL